MASLRITEERSIFVLGPDPFVWRQRIGDISSFLFVFYVLQDREIMRVLVECCLQEKAFNRYYTVLAAKLCEHDKNHKFTLQVRLAQRIMPVSLRIKDSATCVI